MLNPGGSQGCRNPSKESPGGRQESTLASDWPVTSSLCRSDGFYD